MKQISEGISEQINLRLIDYTISSKTLSSAPIIEKHLIKSNSEFSKISENKRETLIKNLNEKWMKTTNKDDQFILNYINNPVGKYLKKQIELFPEMYGEIFVTNKYGVIVSTTGKLTTLVHSQKYWWKNSFESKKIFIDDRGFDESVNGYVLGIVVPILKNNEKIGILKCNINIINLLSNIINKKYLDDKLKIKISRSKGLVVLEKNKQPLSTKINSVILEKINLKEDVSINIKIDSKNYLLVVSQVKLSMGNEEILFGGKGESIAQKNGNDKETWFVLSILNYSYLYLNIYDKLIKDSFVKVIVLILILSIIVYFLSRLIVSPIEVTAKAIKKASEGNMDQKIIKHTNDEIGDISKEFNNLMLNLTNTIKKLKIAKKNSEQANKNKSKFMSIMSHELRTPLNGIIGISKILIQENNSKLSNENIISLELIKNSGVRLLIMVNNILMLSDIESDKYYLNKSSIDFSNFLSNISTYVNGIIRIENKNIYFILENLNKGLELLNVDEYILNQIVINIIDNSIKFTKEGKISLKVYNEKNKLYFEINDTGLGIKEEEMKDLFKPFFQLNEVHSKKYKGSGIGLTVTKNLIEILGGKITIESKYKVGTKVKFFIEI